MLYSKDDVLRMLKVIDDIAQEWKNVRPSEISEGLWEAGIVLEKKVLEIKETL